MSGAEITEELKKQSVLKECPEEFLGEITAKLYRYAF